MSGKLTINEKRSRIGKSAPFPYPSANGAGEEAPHKTCNESLQVLNNLEFPVSSAVKDCLTAGPDIPRLENCGSYIARDNKGQWFFLNHANTWQQYQGPYIDIDKFVPIDRVE